MSEVTVTQADAELVADILELAGTLVIGGNDIAGIRQGLWNDEPSDLGRLLHRAAKARIAHSATPSVDGENMGLVRDVYISGYEQALHNTSLGPEAFYDEWVFVGCPAPVRPFSQPGALSPRPLPTREEVEHAAERAILSRDQTKPFKVAIADAILALLNREAQS